MGSSIDLKALVPSTILTEFYVDMLDAFSAELELYKSDKLTPQKDFYNVRELSKVYNIDRLKEVASTFGYYPNITLTATDDASLTAFYKREIESIPFKIRRKTTYAGYDYIFKSIPIAGYVYNMYYDGERLVRAMNYNDHIVNAQIGTGDGSTTTFTYTYTKPSLYINQSIKMYVETTDINISASDASTEILTTSPDIGSGTYVRETGELLFTFDNPPLSGENIYVELTVDVDDVNLQLDTYNFLDPFLYTLPEYYYSFVESNQFTLDSGYSLDDGYSLDTDILKELTHHLMIEIVPITLIDGKYLSNNLYLDYVFYYVNKYNRKVTEFPHIGAQLTMVCDDSGYYDNLKSTKPDDYTINDLKAKLSTTLNYPGDDLNLEDIFYEIVAGTGSNTMFSYGEVITAIDALDNQFYKRRLRVNESDDTGAYYKLNSYIPLNTIENYTLGTGDGSTIDFSDTLTITNIVPKSFVITYTANNTTYTLSDSSGDGIIGPSSTVFNGTIDYVTGDWEFEFRNHVSSAPDTISVTHPGATSISGSTTTSPIKLDTFTFLYTYNGDSFNASSDALGNITSTGSGHLTSGTIDSSGNYSIVFTIEIDDLTLDLYYDYYLYSVPTLGTDILVSYRTNDNVEITEVGVYNKVGELVIYSVIPPMDCPEREDYYLGLQYYIKI